MKADNITINIANLNDEELEFLNRIHYKYHLDDMKGSKQLQDRIAFNNGWMSEKKEREYVAQFAEA